ncbi:hypothetical protein EON65_28535 [archaeon]|nr:MAG: hypothetical protein EON65_28535 [archaeon]
MYQLERKGGGLGVSAQGDSVYNEILNYYVERWDEIVQVLFKKYGELKSKWTGGRGGGIVGETVFKGWISKISAIVNAERRTRASPSAGKAGKV